MTEGTLLSCSSIRTDHVHNCWVLKYFKRRQVVAEQKKSLLAPHSPHGFATAHGLHEAIEIRFLVPPASAFGQISGVEIREPIFCGYARARFGPHYLPTVGAPRCFWVCLRSSETVLALGWSVLRFVGMLLTGSIRWVSDSLLTLSGRNRRYMRIFEGAWTSENAFLPTPREWTILGKGDNSRMNKGLSQTTKAH